MLAERVGVNQSTICRLADRRTPEPRFSVGVALIELAGGSEKLARDHHIQAPEFCRPPIATKTVADTQPAIEQRQADEPWDGKTERRKLDAPIDCRVSPESVARAKFLRRQQAR